MTISAVGTQEGGATARSATSVSRAFGSNVTSGNLIAVACVKFTPSTDIFTAADCTKSAGTATLGTIALDFQTQVTIGGNLHAVGIWSALVTGTGSCTMQVGGAVAGSYLVLGTGEYSSTVGWGATRFEASNSGSGSTGAPTSGNATSAGAGLFVGVLGVDTSSNISLTEDAAWTSIFAATDGGLDEVGEIIRRIVSAGTTDDANWTAPSTLPWVAAVGVYKETAAGTTITPGGGSVTLSGGVPSVTGGTLVLRPGGGTVTLSGAAPTLSITGGLTITPPGGSLVLTGALPTQTLTLSPPGGASLILTGGVPTVTVGGSITISPGGASLILTGAAPTVNRLIVVPGASLVLIGGVPSAGATLSISPAGGSLVLSSGTPTLSQTANWFVTPQGNSITLIGAAPVITELGSFTIRPDGAQIILTGGLPDVEQTGISGLKPAGRPTRDRRRKRVLVTIDGETFHVEDEGEARRLLETAVQQADSLARSVADSVVIKRQQRAKRDGNLNLKPVRLEVPQIRVDDTSIASIVAEYQSRLNTLYDEARKQADDALIAFHNMELDNDVAIALLLSE